MTRINPAREEEQIPRLCSRDRLGNEFTVGHAIHDFIEWKRLASTPDHFNTLVCITNRYIVPQLASLRVSDLTQEVIRQFIRRVIETPVKHGPQPIGPPVAIDKLDDEACEQATEVHVATLTSIAYAEMLAAPSNRTAANAVVFAK